MGTTNNKELKGFSFADGDHWYFGDEEIAIIDPVTSEIEWVVRKSSLTNDVIEAVRDKKPKHNGRWVVEAKRVDRSATQGSILIQIDGKTIAEFADEKILGDDGFYHSKFSDEELGKLVNGTFWHPMDNVYHDSDRAKYAFYPKDYNGNVQPRALNVETPVGILNAYPSLDPEYPGIYIDLVREGKSVSAPLVLLDFSHTEFPECETPEMAEKGVLVCRCWQDVRQEEYHAKDRTVFTGYDEFFNK